LLEDGDRHNHQHKAGQHHRLEAIANQKVDHPCGNQQQEHRLTYDFYNRGAQRTPVRIAKLVRAVSG